MLPWVLAVLAGAAAAAAGYAGAPWRARLAPLAALARFGAVLLLVALLLDAPAGRAAAPPRFVAVDASRSWLRGGDDDAWREARRLAATAGDSLFLFGDSLRAADVPERPGDLASRVRPAVERAVAAGRPLTVVTDGELDDADALRLLPRGSEVRVPERSAAPDLAVATLVAPRAAVAGDTVEVRVGLAAGGAVPSGALRILVDTIVVATSAVDSVRAGGERELGFRVTVPRGDGLRVLRAVVAVPGDAEPANDTLAAALEVSAAAGVVLVSTQPDPDVRQMLAVLRGTVALPTRAFLRVAPGQWRVEGTLARVSEGEVRAALRAAPVAILHGDTSVFGPPRTATVGALLLVAPPPAGDDWYVASAPPSPVSAALSGVPWDSLPPVNAGPPPRGDFVVLGVRRGREAQVRALVAGSERPRPTAVVAGSGFWRWAFRPGPGADAYAALWGSVFDWLAAGRADARAVVPEAGVLRAGEPVRWRRGAGADSVVRVALRRRGADAADSLVVRFAPGEVVASTPPLAAGVYDVEAPGGRSVLVVSASRELVPRRPTTAAGAVGGGAPVPGAAPPLRGQGWAWILPVLLLCVEWLLRRRQGLR